LLVLFDSSKSLGAFVERLHCSFLYRIVDSQASWVSGEPDLSWLEKLAMMGVQARNFGPDDFHLQRR
jgi:hypothetical protein